MISAQQGDVSISVKSKAKLSSQKDLETEISHMWSTCVILVIAEMLGTAYLSKPFKKKKSYAFQIQKTEVLRIPQSLLHHTVKLKKIHQKSPLLNMKVIIMKQITVVIDIKLPV